MHDTSETSSAQSFEIRGKRVGSVLLKATVSLVALGVIFWKIGVGTIAESFKEIDQLWLGGAALFVLLSVAFSALKWSVTAKGLGLAHGFWRLTSYYFMGFFFNNFLPSSVGGDVVRVWKLGDASDDMPSAAASVVGERIIAMLPPAALFALAFVSIGTFEGKVFVWAAILGPSLLFIVLMIALRNPRLAEKALTTAAGDQFGAVKRWTAQAAVRLNDLFRMPKVVLNTIALTALFHISVAGVNYCILRGLGVEIALAEVIVYSSAALMAAMLPLTISGHGIREVAYGYFFGLAGVSRADAVATSLIFAILVAVLTLPGALLFIFDKRSKKNKEGPSMSKKNKEGSLDE